jgi:hypothetical protein
MERMSTPPMRPQTASPMVLPLREDAGGKRVSPGRAHLAALATQVAFGSGAVIGKIGLQSFNPLVFSLIREACSVPVFYLLHLLATRERPVLHVRFLGDFFLMGFCLFLNQTCFLLGVKFSSPITASLGNLPNPSWRWPSRAASGVSASQCGASSAWSLASRERSCSCSVGMGLSRRAFGEICSSSSIA